MEDNTAWWDRPDDEDDYREGVVDDDGPNEQVQDRGMIIFSDFAVTDAMIRYGGGFTSRLGELWRYADPDNRRQLKRAFPDYWAKYAELVRLQQERQQT